MLRIGQIEATATQDGKYTDGSVAGGIAATRLRAAAFNAMQEELSHIVEAADTELDPADMTQVLAAIRQLTLDRNNPFADIKSDGAAAVATALINLGLGDVALAGTMSGVFDNNGYLTVPAIIGGVKRTLIIQWGQGNNTASATSQTSYTIPFPTKVFQVVAMGYQVAANVQAYVTLNNIGRADYFTWQAFYANGGTAPSLASIAGQVSCRFIAIGW